MAKRRSRRTSRAGEETAEGGRRHRAAVQSLHTRWRHQGESRSCCCGPPHSTSRVSEEEEEQEKQEEETMQRKYLLAELESTAALIKLQMLFLFFVHRDSHQCLTFKYSIRCEMSPQRIQQHTGRQEDVGAQSRTLWI